MITKEQAIDVLQEIIREKNYAKIPNNQIDALELAIKELSKGIVVRKGKTLIEVFTEEEMNK